MWVSCLLFSCSIFDDIFRLFQKRTEEKSLSTSFKVLYIFFHVLLSVFHLWSHSQLLTHQAILYLSKFFFRMFSFGYEFWRTRVTNMSWVSFFTACDFWKLSCWGLLVNLEIKTLCCAMVLEKEMRYFFAKLCSISYMAIPPRPLP
jgi:hypothetical protein